MLKVILSFFYYYFLPSTGPGYNLNFQASIVQISDPVANVVWTRAWEAWDGTWRGEEIPQRAWWMHQGARAKNSESHKLFHIR